MTRRRARLQRLELTLRPRPVAPNPIAEACRAAAEAMGITDAASWIRVAREQQAALLGRPPLAASER